MIEQLDPTDKTDIKTDDNDNSTGTVVTTVNDTVIAVTNDLHYFPDPNSDDCPDIIYYVPKS